MAFFRRTGASGNTTTTQPASGVKGSTRIGCTLCMDFIIVPLFVLAFIGALIHFARFFEIDVRGVPELREPPYNPNIWPGTVLPVVAGSLAIFWIIICFFAGIFLMPTRIYWLVVTLGRLLCVILLVVSVVLQLTYLPRPMTSCTNDSSWPEGSDVDPDTPTMYDLLPYREYWSKTHRDYINESPCDRLWFIWMWEIFCLAILALAVFFSAYMWLSPTPVKYGYIEEQHRMTPKLRKWARNRFVDMPGRGGRARGQGYTECGPAGGVKEDQEAMRMEPYLEDTPHSSTLDSDATWMRLGIITGKSNSDPHQILAEWVPMPPGLEEILFHIDITQPEAGSIRWSLPGPANPEFSSEGARLQFIRIIFRSARTVLYTTASGSNDGCYQDTKPAHAFNG